MTVDTTAVITVAGLMELAARTAPKAKGVDTILVRILTGNEIQTLADRLAATGERRKTGFFVRDAKNIAACDACVIIGAKGRLVAGVNCGACGYATCEELAREGKKTKEENDGFFRTKLFGADDRSRYRAWVCSKDSPDP